MIVVGFLIASLISMEFCWIMSLTPRYMQGNTGINAVYIAPVENRPYLMSDWKSSCVCLIPAHFSCKMFVQYVRTFGALKKYWRKVTCNYLGFFPFILLQKFSNKKQAPYSVAFRNSNNFGVIWKSDMDSYCEVDSQSRLCLYHICIG